MSDLQECPTPPETLKEVKEWKGWWPGQAGVANERGYNPGCAFKIFAATWSNELARSVTADEHANEWFAANRGLLVVDIKFSGSTILVTYTKSLDPEEYDEMQAFTKKARELADEEKRARDFRAYEAEKATREAEEKRKVDAAAEDKELRRLADLGRRHEKNCKKVKS